MGDGDGDSGGNRRADGGVSGEEIGHGACDTQGRI